MNVQKVTLFCIIASYLIFCHLIWNGCYNFHSSTEDDIYDILYSKKKQKAVKLELENEPPLVQLQNGFIKGSVCPVLPRPIRSIFHLKWFRKSSDLMPLSIYLYSMFDEKNNLLGFFLLSSAIFTIIEWAYIVYFTGLLLWDVILKPIIKIIYLVIFIYVLIRLSVIFLPYTKSFITNEHYTHISSVIFNSHNILTL
ncbi:conserved protein, unknown function, partial [Hepatocystis sp. ex Piliocolobus tephrosceles]